MAYSNPTDEKIKPVWNAMRNRCYNKRDKGYRNYGARGIGISGGWQDYGSFKRWYLANHKKGYSIERVDNNGDYSPDNCRMATRKEQALNRRTNTKIRLLGRTQALSQWIEELGLKSSTVRQRYYVYGWSVEKSLGLGG